MTVITLKDFTYEKKKYKFIEPLKVYINDFERQDGKIMTELYIPSIPDGYTGEQILEKDYNKVIKTYMNSIFEDFLSKSDSELDICDLEYKKKVLGMIKH